MLGVLSAIISSIGTSPAKSINIPNASFESPKLTNSFFGINVQDWQEHTKPDDYDETGGFRWNQLVGIYTNLTDSSTIVNMDGSQGLWLFAVPDAGLSIDYHSVDYDDPEATHAFDAAFDVGRSYRLTVGVIGGGLGMFEGVPLEMALYYHDANTNAITVASKTITYNLAQFPTRTSFTDVSLDVGTVLAEDDWAGKRMGISFTSTVTPEMEGGHWDLDNVRLESFPAPTMTEAGMTTEGFKFTLESAPDTQFELLSATDPGLPVGQWSSILTFLNETGMVSITNAVGTDSAFYQVRQVP